MPPRKRSDDATESGPPTRFAEGPPPASEGTGLPLVAVLEIQRTLGILERSVQNLTETQKAMQIELTGVCQQVNTAKTVIWVVGAVIAGTIGLVGWIVSSAIAVLPTLMKP
jgi:hypothetical protein